MAGAAQHIVVDVPREDLFEVIRDYVNYPEFLSDMESVEVKKREGDVAEVEFTLNVIKRLRYTLRLVETAPEGLSWTLVEGMFKRNEGGWTLEELPGGRTRATYRIELTVGVFVPGSIVNRLVGKTLPATLEAFKKRAESLHARS
jgi:coenzyme Q-binding protein COQ10